LQVSGLSTFGNISMPTGDDGYAGRLRCYSGNGNLTIESTNKMYIGSNNANIEIQPGNGQTVLFSAGMLPGKVQFGVPVISTPTTAATSTTTGAVTVAGGVGVAGNAFVGSIYTNNYYYANGAPVSFGGSSYGNANVSAYLPTHTGFLAATTINAATVNASTALYSQTIGSYTGNITLRSAIGYVNIDDGVRTSTALSAYILANDYTGNVKAGNVLSDNYRYANGSPISFGGGGGFSNMQVFTSSGTFTVPTGITKVKVTVVGGGAGPGNIGGGGGGGTAIEIISGLTPGNTVSVTVGSGGGGFNISGGTSSFGAFCSATGGIATSGLGGIGSGGDLNIGGQSGSEYIEYVDGNSELKFSNGQGGSSFMGGGGGSGNGRAYGGGAGDSGDAGAAGVVVVEW